MNVRTRFSRRMPLAILATVLTVTAAGAATVHRSGISQATGSEGAQTYLQNSATGSALQGEVGGSSPNTAIQIPFGVLGEYDPAGTTFGVGTLGISSTGYAVAGEAVGIEPTILAYAGGMGIGLESISPAASSSEAVHAYAAGNGSGIISESVMSDGGDFSADGAGEGIYTNSLQGDSLYANTGGTTGGVAILGEPTGEGVEADGYSGTAADPALTARDYAGNTDLFGTYSCALTNDACTEPESFIVQASSANRSTLTTPYYPGASDVQVSGDLYVYGKVYQQCASFPATTTTKCDDATASTSATTSGVTRSAGGDDVRVYAPAQGVRSVEDFGQARLVNGHAYVRMDPAFARTTEPTSTYLVFVTPEGDSRGVFTTNHSLAGFDVHENGGGRSSFTIDYRIVAKPLGDASRRFVAESHKTRIAGYNVAKHARTRGFKVKRTMRTRMPIAPLSLASRPHPPHE